MGNLFITLYPDNEKSRKEPNKLNFTTWDIETDYPNNPKDILLIGFYNPEMSGKKYYDKDGYRCFDRKEYKTNESLFNNFLGEVIKDKYTGFYHYAHFGGKFDFIYLLETLKNYNNDFDIVDVNGRILEIDIKNKVSDRIKHIKFRDSFAIMPKKLHDLTYSFNVPHKKKEINFFDIEEPNYVDKYDNFDLFKEYLEYDCKGLYESIKYFENIINQYNGEIKLTIASTSLDIFKHSYLKTVLNSLHDIKIGKNFKNEDIILKVEDIVRQYFIGGRTEIFKRYGEYLFYYDVNSLYPYVMLNPMPISQPIYCLPENINFNKDIGFINCEIEFWNDKIVPLIPYRIQMKYSNKLIYPLGKWNSWIDLDMYRKAIQLGYKINVKEGIIFNSDNIFKDFVNDFYELRSLNDSMKLIAKLILNSNYGKWSQKRIRKQIIKYSGMDEKILKTLIPYNLDNFLYQQESISNSKHIIPSISSHITNLAQLELYKYIEKVEKDEIYYCDTDSIITTKQMQTSKKLGDIKLEYEIDRACFLLPKTYAFQYLNDDGILTDKIVMKGFIKNKFTFDDFYNALITDNYSKFNYNINKIWGFKESIRRNNTFLTYDDKKNSIKSKYDKRKICNDNINTEPLMINEGIIL